MMTSQSSVLPPRTALTTARCWPTVWRWPSHNGNLFPGRRHLWCSQGQNTIFLDRCTYLLQPCEYLVTCLPYGLDLIGSRSHDVSSYTKCNRSLWVNTALRRTGRQWSELGGILQEEDRHTTGGTLVFLFFLLENNDYDRSLYIEGSHNNYG